MPLLTEATSDIASLQAQRIRAQETVNHLNVQPPYTKFNEWVTNNTPESVANRLKLEPDSPDFVKNLTRVARLREFIMTKTLPFLEKTIDSTQKQSSSLDNPFIAADYDHKLEEISLNGQTSQLVLDILILGRRNGIQLTPADIVEIAETQSQPDTTKDAIKKLISRRSLANAGFELVRQPDFTLSLKPLIPEDTTEIQPPVAIAFTKDTETLTIGGNSITLSRIESAMLEHIIRSITNISQLTPKAIFKTLQGAGSQSKRNHSVSTTAQQINSKVSRAFGKTVQFLQSVRIDESTHIWNISDSYQLPHADSEEPFIVPDYDSTLEDINIGGNTDTRQAIIDTIIMGYRNGLQLTSGDIAKILDLDIHQITGARNKMVSRGTLVRYNRTIVKNPDDTISIITLTPSINS